MNEGRSFRPTMNLAILWLMVSILLWGGQAVAIKVAVESLGPVFTLACRFAVALPCLALIAGLWGEKLALTREEWFPFLFSGLLFGSQITLLTVGTDGSTSIHSIILIHTFPLFSAVLGHWFITSLTTRTVIGILVAFLGVVILVSGRESREESSSLAVGALLLGALIMGGKIVFMKRLLHRVSPLKLAFWDHLGPTLALLIPLLLLAPERGKALWDPIISGAILYQGVLSSSVAFVLWLMVLREHDPNRMNVARLFTPVVGVALGHWLLQESVTFHIVSAVAFVAVGNLILRTKGSPTDG